MRLRVLTVLAVLCAPGLAGEEPEPQPPAKPKLKLARITSPITVDGDLSDAGWKEATEVPLIYEINPGDNTTPAVKSIARIGYDDKFFYVSFWCEDPDISKLRAPFVDRDGINDDQDYVGILLDVENQNHSAIDFWIGPTRHPGGLGLLRGDVHRGLRARLLLAIRRLDRDGLLDGGGRDPAVLPALSGRRTHRTGRSRSTARIRAIATTSSTASAFRAARAAFSATRRRRGHRRAPAGRAPGPRPLRRGHEHEGVRRGRGLRRRHHDERARSGSTRNGSRTPTPSWTRRSTPTFRRSSPTPRRLRSTSGSPCSIRRSVRSSWSTWISCRRRSRPSTRARSPRRSGARGSRESRAARTSPRWWPTIAAAEPSIIPGPVFSDTAPQDFESTVAIARVRQDLGASFAGALATGRVIQGGGYNAVVGGDFHWQAGADDVVNGQYLYSFSQNPDRPDLYPGVDSDRRARASAMTGAVGALDDDTGTGPWATTDFADGFLADDGFVPQVGYRESSAEHRLPLLPDRLLLADSSARRR